MVLSRGTIGAASIYEHAYNRPCNGRASRSHAGHRAEARVTGSHAPSKSVSGSLVRRAFPQEFPIDLDRHPLPIVRASFHAFGKFLAEEEGNFRIGRRNRGEIRIVQIGFLYSKIKRNVMAKSKFSKFCK